MADVTQIGTEQPVTPEADLPLLTITPIAASKVRELMAERQLEGFAARFVQGRLPGLSYGMPSRRRSVRADRVWRATACALVIDPTSLSYMAGSELTSWICLMGGGFAINNPNTLPARLRLRRPARTRAARQVAAAATRPVRRFLIWHDQSRRCPAFLLRRSGSASRRKAPPGPSPAKPAMRYPQIPPSQPLPPAARRKGSRPAAFSLPPWGKGRGWGDRPSQRGIQEARRTARNRLPFLARGPVVIHGRQGKGATVGISGHPLPARRRGG